MTFDQLHKAYQKCRAGKTPPQEQTSFELKLGENLNELLAELSENTYRPSPASYFVVLEPKPRLIFAASFACLKHRGPFKAIEYFKQNCQKISQGGRAPTWVLQLDVESFFARIHRPTLKRLALSRAKDPFYRNLIEICFDHDARQNAICKSTPENLKKVPPEKSWLSQPADRGIPIGNLTSQFGANLYMNALDHFITRGLKPMAYLRYMDDLTIVESSPQGFSQMTDAIENWLTKNRGLNLNPRKTKVTETKNEIDYLGYRHKMDPKLGLMISLPQPKKKWKFVNAAKQIENANSWERKSAHPLALKSHDRKLKNQIHGLNSRLGGLTKSKSYALRQKTLKKLQDKVSGPEIDPDFFDRWEVLSIGKKYHKIKIR